MNSHFSYRKILTPRRLRIDYISPPICEAEFSSTGVSTISLQPIFRATGPTGLVMEWRSNRWYLRWNTYPGALCYSVYKLADELDPNGPYTLVAECITDTSLDLLLLGSGTYRITVITRDGESELSDPLFGDPNAPPPPGGPGEPPADFPEPTALWAMDEAPASIVDAINGELLSIPSFSFGEYLHDNVAGKVGTTALRLLQGFAVGGVNFGNCQASAQGSPGLVYTGTGFTLTSWVKVLSTFPDGSNANYGLFMSYLMSKASDGDSPWAFVLRYIPNSGTLIFALTSNNGLVTELSGSIAYTPSFDWEFFRVWYDATDGMLRLKINEGATQTATGTYFIAGAPHDDGTMDTEAIVGSADGIIDYAIDEFSLYTYVLSTAEASYLYNSGAGRAYPFT